MKKTLLCGAVIAISALAWAGQGADDEGDMSGSSWDGGSVGPGSTGTTSGARGSSGLDTSTSGGQGTSGASFGDAGVNVPLTPRSGTGTDDTVDTPTLAPDRNRSGTPIPPTRVPGTR